MSVIASAAESGLLGAPVAGLVLLLSQMADAVPEVVSQRFGTALLIEQAIPFLHCSASVQIFCDDEPVFDIF